MSPSKIVSAVLFACLIVAIGFTIYIAIMPPPGERFTEFYILGPSGKAYDYPTDLVLGENGTVIIGVVNHEYENVTYTILIKLDNETIATINNVMLSHGAKWEQNYTFTPEKTGERMKLEFLLFKDAVNEPYRSLHLWVTVRSKE